MRDTVQHSPAEMLYALAQSVTCHASAGRALERLCEAYGFTTYAVMAFPEQQIEDYTAAVLLTDNHPEFTARYAEGNHLPNNITITRLKQAVEPVVWDIRSYRHDGRKVERQTTIDLLAEYGMMMGANLPLHDSRGNRGALVLSGARDEPSVTELAELNFVGRMIFDRLMGLSAEEVQAQAYALCARERDILAWAGEGKTSWEIANILNLSEHTVNQYLAKSIHKLGAANRVHAVAKALRMKLIA